MIRFGTHSVGQWRGHRAGPVRRLPLGRPGVGAWLAALVLVCASVGAAAAFDPDTPDVVAIVDTSKSMSERGMDPERTSLLVSRLLADIVPGHFAVVRLMDLSADRALLPRTETRETGACSEGGGVCKRVEPVGDWGEMARTGRYGALEREHRPDPAFKERLAAHLAQTGTNSYFFMSFRAAQGLFERHAAGGEPSANRTVVWLSDGRDENTGDLAVAVSALREAGVRIDTIVFGRGDPAIPEQLGLAPVRVTSPGELMRAFAQVFRQIMRAPYRVDHLVEEQPEFRVHPNVATLWVVVFGDARLGEVMLRGADGRTWRADYAADRWPSAGAYRVARIESPAAGTWRVETAGGGPRRAYAVIAQSALAVALVEPREARAGTETRLVAAVTAGADGAPVTDREALEGARISGRIDGTEVLFTDDGHGADATAGDGRFSAVYRFERAGPQTVDLRLDSPYAQRSGRASVEVAGVFRYTGADPEVDFGTLAAPTPGPRCLPVPLDTRAGALEHQGRIPVELAGAGGLPAGHRLWVQIGGARLDPGGTVDWTAGAPLEVCFAADATAPSSTAGPGRALLVRVPGSDTPAQRVRIGLYWDLRGLSFWQRWGWLVLLVLAVLAALFVVLGFVLPRRFAPTLAIGYGPERDDIDEYPPQAVRRWPGVGIGFYRHARAFLHRDFRLNGRAAGALAGLHVQGHGVRVQAQRGLTLFREDLTGTWTPVAAAGELARPGEVYRIGDTGPFFRLSAR